MQQPNERRIVGTCCVCRKPVYRDQNPLLADVDCPMRHRECVKPKPARA